MATVKTSFFCQNCGTQHAKWQGQCNGCKEWNTLTEEVVQKTKKESWQAASSKKKTASKPLPINQIQFDTSTRIDTQDNELNRVLGGGIVLGSLVLLGGEPGIGKSTLLLQISVRTSIKVLYVSGEESQQQIKMRADRMGSESNNCYILNETNTQSIFQQINELKPELVIIDSVQTLHTQHIDSSAGSVSQIRECTSEFLKFAKETHTPVLLVGHITKDGAIAGPKILEHMVDTVLHFEGDRNHLYRILRVQKNRFGSTAELGIYEMQQFGLRPVSNPSELLISQHTSVSGSAIAATVEGMRPLMIEIQALVSSAVYGTPQRSTTGFNGKRLNMLLAVLEKRAGFRLGTKDVFLNITGGIRIEDPAIDLAVVAAILSSNEDIAISKDICFAAEIGLSGEIRPVPKLDQRIQEAEKLGFTKLFYAKNAKISASPNQLKLIPVDQIEDVVQALF